MHRDFDYISYLDQTKGAINRLKDRIDQGDIYRATDEVIDPDTLFEKAAHLYVKNQDSPNFPVAAPLYLHVDVALQPGCECPCPCPPDHIIGVTQTVWDDPAGQVWRRLGTVTNAFGQAPVVEWGEWKRIGGADCLNCVTRDQVRIKLNAPITFYIRHDGNDATGDGLTEATALATWSGFYNRYIIGPDAFDANFNTVTINFGPGEWSGALVVNQGNFIGAHNLIISGASMDDTTFSNPTGASIYVCGGTGTGGWVTVSNCGFENYVNGICVGQQGIVQPLDVKFKKPVSSWGGNRRAIYAFYNGTVKGGPSAANPGKIYFDGFNGDIAYVSANCSRIDMNYYHVILENNCSWTNFAYAIWFGEISVTPSNFTYTGSATGRRFRADRFGLLSEIRYNLDAFPGSIAGSADPATFGLAY